VRPVPLGVWTDNEKKINTKKKRKKQKKNKKTIYTLPQECLIWSERKLFEKDSLNASGPKFFGGSIYTASIKFRSTDDSKGGGVKTQ
jgi:hypothetical protein